MNNFIWQNKKPRLSLTRMNKQMQMGDLGLPNMKTYHMAVSLDQDKDWCHNSSDKRWVLIEAGMVNINNWKAILLDPKGHVTST